MAFTRCFKLLPLQDDHGNGDYQTGLNGPDVQATDLLLFLFQTVYIGCHIGLVPCEKLISITLLFKLAFNHGANLAILVR